jgi:hypothetical protein
VGERIKLNNRKLLIMRNLLSWLFYIPGIIIFGGAVLYSAYLSFIVVFDVLPAWAAYLSFIFFPFVYGMAPFYSGFVMGDWTLVLISYLGWIPGAILFAIGSKISGD